MGVGDNTLRTAIQTYSAMPDPVVDETTERCPFLANMPFFPTNLGDSHKYKVLKDITTLEAVNLNAAYGHVGADFNMKTKDVAFYAGTREVHVNEVDVSPYNGSLDAYIQEEAPYIWKQTLSDIEFAMIYGTLRPFAKEKGKLQEYIAYGSTSGNKYSSLLVVRFERGQMHGLYNPDRAQLPKPTPEGEMPRGILGTIPVNGGNRAKNSAGKSVYQVDLEAGVGILPVNGRNISGIVNIDIADVRSSDANRTKFGDMVSDAVLDANRNYGGDTVIVTSSRVKSQINRITNGEKVEYMGLDMDAIDGVPIIDSPRMTATEAGYEGV